MTKVVLCLAVLFAGSAAAEVLDLSKEELKSYMATLQRNARHKNPLVRTTAARDLELLQSVDSAEIAVDLLGDPEPPVRFAAIRSLSSWTDEEALRWLCTKGIKKGSKQARANVVSALGLGQDRDFVHAAVLEQLDSSSDEMQAAAVDALGHLGHREDMERVAPLASSSSMRVREAVAVAMGTLGSSAYMETMAALIADESWEVRAAMITAAGRLNIKPVVRLLVSRLAVEEELRLQKNLHTSLVKLTGEDFGRDPDLWISWWNANEKDYGETEAIEIVVKKSDYGETSEYYGIKIETTRVLFMVDVSDSMHKGGGRITVTGEDGEPRVIEEDNSMAIARKELARVVSTLRPDTRFNIMTYADGTEQWKSAPVTATASNRKAAVKWISSLRPKGLATTNTHGALMDALGAGNSSIAAAARAPREFDSLYFLADGQPTTGITTDPEEILEDVRLANPDARMEIHTILIPNEGERAREFMQALAEQNGGRCVVLGR